MKILIRMPNWLGDAVMSTAFISGVRQFYPEATIDVIIKKEIAAIASLVPGINKIHSFSKHEFVGLAGAYRFGKNLQAEKYDIFFSLPDSISAATMGWATNAKQRVGFSKEGGFFLLTKVGKRPQNVHRVEEYTSLLEQFTGSEVQEKQVKLDTGTPVTPTNLVLINFNSEAESRRMPLGKGINLISALTNTFKNTQFGFIGSAKEKDYVDQLIINNEHADRLQNYAGQTGLVDLADLMASSKVLLTTDSGPAHLANSLGTPVIALFGAGNEYNTGPYNKTDLTIIRANKLDCEPCVKNTCELYGMPQCMKQLDEIEIISALTQYALN